MRAASRVVSVLNEIQGVEPHSEPAHTTVQNFILRIGLYLLQQAQARARPHHGNWNVEVFCGIRHPALRLSATESTADAP